MEQYKVDDRYRKITNDGIVILSDNGIVESFYRGNFSSLIAIPSDEVEKYNKLAKIYDYPKINSDIQYNKDEWLFPKEYQEMDIKEFLLSKCDNDEETNRILEEYELFKNKNMDMLLKYMVYLVDVFKKHNIIYGVGRGSSVASLCLYKIGIHRVNPLKFNINIEDFFKEK